MSHTTNAILAVAGLAAVGGVALQGNSGKVQDVNVVNQPTVAVAGPVNVHVAEHREPVHFSYELTGSALGNTLTPPEQLYQVPAGKRLFLTHVSGLASSPENVEVIAIHVTFGTSSTSFRGTHNLAIPRPSILTSSDFSVASISQTVDWVVNPGERVGLQFSRSSGFVGSPASRVSLNFSGYLADAPAP